MVQIHIVALGSSFAAGPGIPPYADSAARRSSKNYAHLSAAHLNARLTDLSVSGATLANVIDEQQTFFRSRFEPQLLGLPPDADVVTITGGGNDLAYIGSMMTDSLRAYWVGRLFVSAAEKEIPMDADALSKRFVDVIDRIEQQAPRARIYLVEYLTLLGPDVRPGIDVAFDQGRIDHHRKVSDVLNDAYRRAGEARPQVVVVPMAKKSRDHGLGSEQPWVDPLSVWGLWNGSPCLHPNERGMQAVADVLVAMIQNRGDTA